MEQRNAEPRKEYPNLLPTAVAMALTAIAAVACDRPASRYAAAPGDAQSGAPRAPMSQAASEAESTAQQPTQMPSRESLGDTVITGKINTALLTDPGMAGADVSVNTDRGVVSLTGTVKSQEQIAIASAHAQRQDGVMRVDNHLAAIPQ